MCADWEFTEVCTEMWCHLAWQGHMHQGKQIGARTDQLLHEAVALPTTGATRVRVPNSLTFTTFSRAILLCLA